MKTFKNISTTASSIKFKKTPTSEVETATVMPNGLLQCYSIESDPTGSMKDLSPPVVEDVKESRSSRRPKAEPTPVVEEVVVKPDAGTETES